ncbi:hypothetical protein [Nitrosospira sp. Is2]|uniref:hypothetical protein n=1 Tax=Nitrosospira sp. Is2 TaxID=3080532 RepID=UPI002953C0C4|nr:hypothetical protein [Nitrosospira sp. Is2]WON75233.1 hypothetical protein R5L00_07085 [Nitrosospira sp. Is2]
MESRIIRLINCWTLSFKLWCAFYYLTLKNCFRFRLPRVIDDNESVGRALFSGNVKKDKVLAGAFLPPKSDPRAISVNRISRAPIEWFNQLGQHNAFRRAGRTNQNIKYYGMVSIQAKKLRGIEIDTKQKFAVVGSPTLQNALHANIMLPPSEGKDFDLYIADTLLQHIDPYQPPEQ